MYQNFVNLLKILNDFEMETPKPFGWFHLIWIGLIFFFLILFIVLKKKNVKVNEKIVFYIYGFGALILEVIKQVMWSIDWYDDIYPYWEYRWFSAPYQLCTTPMFVAIILCFSKSEKIRAFLRDYLAYFTILCTSLVMILPETCFQRDVLVNIHTMYLHAGSVIVSLFVIINDRCDKNIKGFLRGSFIFLLFVASALALDIWIYNTGILAGETLNLFYISPYFECSLPVLCDIKEKVPYIVFLLIYLGAYNFGAFMVNRLVSFKEERTSRKKEMAKLRRNYI